MPSTVILGTGIIGLSTAYYLSRLAESDPPDSTADKVEIHLVEPSPELFASASGKAAGFLAKDWYAAAVAPLGEFSFDLHRRLAEEHGGREKWGWSESVSYSLDREDSEGEASDSDEDDDEDAEPLSEEDDGTEHPPPRSRHHARNDLDWLMSGSSRALLVAQQQSEAAAAEAHAADVEANPNANPEVDEDEDHPRWIRAKRSSMQAISDRTTTGQVYVSFLCVCTPPSLPLLLLLLLLRV